ncbi:required for respiratory growth protein 9 mitochondrial [Penicillium riverlandense]|uniref:required for respiratory growth protein 9 mitochondrial n=1 Tax=Penicillium riverlandense TaxID=1903569 RepID=UPI0025494C78|nr:required for respiratory growth protein 9 mitochondrial [Penicillium riverlandense]KAJ5805272.1 required for respiratory growth protein 9 mitochondrial [Penicillium riverlandense]
MATRCTASSRLGLPTVLRSLFRAEFAGDLCIPNTLPNRSLLASRPHLSPRGLQHSRQFSSIPTLRDAQDIVFDLTTPAGTPSETKTSERSESGRPGKGRKARNNSKAIRNESTSDPTKKKKKLEHWQVQKEALKQKFPVGWSPMKKLSPDALEGIRHLHATAPDRFTTPVLANQFQVSPEAIRRILKGKWRPSEEEIEKRRVRWEKRHDRIWGRKAELGLRMPTERSKALTDSNILYEQN